MIGLRASTTTAKKSSTANHRIASSAPRRARERLCSHVKVKSRMNGPTTSPHIAHDPRVDGPIPKIGLQPARSPSRAPARSWSSNMSSASTTSRRTPRTHRTDRRRAPRHVSRSETALMSRNTNDAHSAAPRSVSTSNRGSAQSGNCRCCRTSRRRRVTQEVTATLRSVHHQSGRADVSIRIASLIGMKYL